LPDYSSVIGFPAVDLDLDLDLKEMILLAPG